MFTVVVRCGSDCGGSNGIITLFDLCDSIVFSGRRRRRDSSQWKQQWRKFLSESKMKIRSRPLPNTIGEWATTLFLAFVIPLTYWYELWIVAPALMSFTSGFYIFNFMLGTFILFNVVGNMIAIMLCNTSIIGEKIVRPPRANMQLWKFCSACESITPPRSWHCSTCRVCILKRDHHCVFTGKVLYLLSLSLAGILLIFLNFFFFF